MNNVAMLVSACSEFTYRLRYVTMRSPHYAIYHICMITEWALRVVCVNVRFGNLQNVLLVGLCAGLNLTLRVHVVIHKYYVYRTVCVLSLLTFAQRVVSFNIGCYKTQCIVIGCPSDAPFRAVLWIRIYDYRFRVTCTRFNKVSWILRFVSREHV